MKLRTLSFALMTLICAVAYGASGLWTSYPVFSAPPKRVIDTGRKVYYASGGALFCYDKENAESFSYTTSNKLSGITVSDIFPLSAKQILIAYTDGNIDILDEENRVVNMSDIPVSDVAPPLTINRVAVANDRIYVATAFGLVEFSDSRHEVIRSGIYNKPVTAVATIGGNIVIACDGKIRFTTVGNRIHSLEDFRELCPAYNVTDILALEGGAAAVISENGSTSTISRMVFNTNRPEATETEKITTFSGRFYLTREADGEFLFPAAGSLQMLSADGQLVTEIARFPEDFDGCVIGTASGPNEIWSLTRDGIACHSFKDGGISMLSERHRPEQFSVKEVCYFTPSANGEQVYVMNNGSTAYRFDRPFAEGFSKPLNLSRLDLAQDNATDLTPYPVEAYLPLARERQNKLGKYMLGPTSVAENPDDSNILYVSTSTDGLHILRDGIVAGRYNELNSPLKRIDERNIAYHVCFDRGGNLWMSTTSEGDDEGPVFILPADKVKLAPEEVKASDWITLQKDDNKFPGTHDVQTLHCRHSNMIFRIDAYDQFLAYDTRGTFNDFTDDDYRIWYRPTDQDGNIFAPQRYSAICEDRNGTVWIGTDIGIIEVPNSPAALSGQMTVRRLKVPRGDGSGQADYLLGNELIYDITVDAANRKWVATEKSGLFLVSADGSRVLENFTTSNSILPSNTVYSVFADPYSRKIYVGTPEGLFSYESDASPTADNYSAIKVYPNPVKPDYSGPIHVEGLMEGSVVKITDASGAIIHQGRSEGGMFTWDGYLGTRRPPTGVYYILVTNARENNTNSASAKFMIIN